MWNYIFDMCFFTLQVLLAFANGLNQLYFYYETKASEEKGKCKGIRCVEQNNAFSTWVSACVEPMCDTVKEGVKEREGFFCVNCY